MKFKVLLSILLLLCCVSSFSIIGLPITFNHSGIVTSFFNIGDTVYLNMTFRRSSTENVKTNFIVVRGPSGERTYLPVFCGSEYLVSQYAYESFYQWNCTYMISDTHQPGTYYADSYINGKLLLYPASVFVVSLPPPPPCSATGEVCSSDNDCCSGAGYCVNDRCTICSRVGGPCARNENCCADEKTICFANVCSACHDVGQTCITALDCCAKSDLICYLGICSTCKKSAEACTSSRDCCTGLRCFGGFCSSCKTQNEQCTFPEDCCSGFACYGGVCTTCSLEYGSCTIDADCCPNMDLVCYNNICSKCQRADSACSFDSDCCGSLICYNGVCSQCVVERQKCFKNSDCCSGFACFQGVCSTCHQEGEICDANSDCCKGFRCLDGYCTKCRLENQSCITTEDCCEGRCINNICVECSANGEKCVSDTDCCPEEGLCTDGFCSDILTTTPTLSDQIPEGRYRVTLIGNDTFSQTFFNATMMIVKTHYTVFPIPSEYHGMLTEITIFNSSGDIVPSIFSDEYVLLPKPNAGIHYLNAKIPAVRIGSFLPISKNTLRISILNSGKSISVNRFEFYTIPNMSIASILYKAESQNAYDPISRYLSTPDALYVLETRRVDTASSSNEFLIEFFSANCSRLNESCATRADCCEDAGACVNGVCKKCHEIYEQCETTDECCSAFRCIDNECLSCSRPHEQCESNGDCCPGAGPCINGVCMACRTAGQGCDSGHCCPGLFCVMGVCRAWGYCAPLGASCKDIPCCPREGLVCYAGKCSTIDADNKPSPPINTSTTKCIIPPKNLTYGANISETEQLCCIGKYAGEFCVHCAWPSMSCNGSGDCCEGICINNTCTIPAIRRLVGLGGNCNSSGECESGYCNGSVCTFLLQKQPPHRELSQPCAFDSECKVGRCIDYKCQIASIDVVLGSVGIKPKPGCTGIFEDCNSSLCAFICNALWVVLILLSLLSGHIYYSKTFDKTVSLMLCAIPLVIGLVFWPSLGLLVAVLEFVYLISVRGQLLSGK